MDTANELALKLKTYQDALAKHKIATGDNLREATKLLHMAILDYNQCGSESREKDDPKPWSGTVPWPGTIINGKPYLVIRKGDDVRGIPAEDLDLQIENLYEAKDVPILREIKSQGGIPTYKFDDFI
jgi:hypothetical protein